MRIILSYPDQGYTKKHFVNSAENKTNIFNLINLLFNFPKYGLETTKQFSLKISTRFTKIKRISQQSGKIFKNRTKYGFEKYVGSTSLLKSFYRTRFVFRASL
jgi:hypothetical protein